MANTSRVVGRMATIPRDLLAKAKGAIDAGRAEPNSLIGGESGGAK